MHLDCVNLFLPIFMLHKFRRSKKPNYPKYEFVLLVFKITHDSQIYMPHITLPANI